MFLKVVFWPVEALKMMVLMFAVCLSQLSIVLKVLGFRY